MSRMSDAAIGRQPIPVLRPIETTVKKLTPLGEWSAPWLQDHITFQDRTTDRGYEVKATLRNCSVKFDCCHPGMYKREGEWTLYVGAGGDAYEIEPESSQPTHEILTKAIREWVRNIDGRKNVVNGAT